MKAGTCLALLALLSTPVLAESNLRDPFVRIQPAPSSPSRPELFVTGVMQSGDRYTAIVRYGEETRIVEVGDTVAGSRVYRIGTDGVTLLAPGDAQRVRLGEQEVTLSFEYAWVYGLEGVR